MQGYFFDASFRVDHISFGEKSNFERIRQHFPDTAIKHPLDGFARQTEKQEVKITKNGVQSTEMRPKRMATGVFINAVPSTFSS